MEMAGKTHLHLQHHRGVQEMEGHLIMMSAYDILYERSLTIIIIVRVQIVTTTRRSMSHSRDEGCSPLQAMCRQNC
jgi:hypothetical protein